MPIDKSKYPADWNEISRRIRFERAGNKCEWCGLPNGEKVVRDSMGRGYLYDRYVVMSAAKRFVLFGSGIQPTPITVVLTVAHIDHDTTNNAEDNLAALCQRCHLTHDAKHHAKNAAQTRRLKKIRAGQSEMEL